MLPIFHLGDIIDFLLDALKSPKKLSALAALLVGIMLIQHAFVAATENLDHPFTYFFAFAAGGFFIGSAGAIYLYWSHASEKSMKDMDQIAVETLNKHAEITQKPQSPPVTPWRESHQSEPHEADQQHRQDPSG